jgi:hypothetical protein
MLFEVILNMIKIFCLILILFSQFAFANKKNVCAMTINSNDEIELFKKYLPTSDWNFIELVPNNAGPTNNNWFSQACEKKITCDILVISGHFGGAFFGSSKYNLTLQDLESKSCESSCAGILQKPKEVFLFGCNTLATKAKDQRTPDEYLQILLADGFSPAQASQIVSFRYSDYGESFKSKMTLAFAKTPNLYGFSSIGPSGRNIAPLLGSYLRSSQNDYKNFDLIKTKPQKNVKLFSSLKNTSLAQATGSLLTMKSPNEKPYCYLKNQTLKNFDKLLFVKKLFQENKALSLLDHIQAFLHPLVKNSNELTAEEQNIISEISQNQNIKTDLMSLLQLKGDLYIPLKANVLQTLYDLQFINLQFATESLQKLLDLNSEFSVQKKDLICSSQFNLNLPIWAVPELRWKELNFLTSLICLKSKDLAIQEKFKNIMLSNSDPILRATAIWYFYHIQTDRIDILKSLDEIIKKDSDDNVKKSAQIVLNYLTK